MYGIPLPSAVLIGRDNKMLPAIIARKKLRSIVCVVDCLNFLNFLIFKISPPIIYLYRIQVYHISYLISILSEHFFIKYYLLLYSNSLYIFFENPPANNLLKIHFSAPCSSSMNFCGVILCSFTNSTLSLVNISGLSTP